MRCCSLLIALAIAHSSCVAQAWSPLLWRGDLPRTLPRLGTSEPLLWRVSPRADLFWGAGNPAALATHPLLRRSTYAATSARDRGDFRRPLDPARETTVGAKSEAWGGLGVGTPAWGLVQIDRATWSPSTETVAEEPYRSSPFVLTDTTTAPLDRTRIRLEGTAARRAGPWALGAALGYEARHHETSEAAVSRRSELSAPGISFGALRLAHGFEVGVHGGARRRTEAVRLIERGGEALVHDLVVYRDVTPIHVTQSYFRRAEELVPWLGAGASGATGGWRWALWGERASLRERRWTAEANDPPADRWSATTTSLGAATDGTIAAWGGAVYAEVRYRALSGTGSLAQDSTPAIFDGDESTLDARAELRLAPASRNWHLAFDASYSVEDRRRSDLVTQIYSRMRGQRPAWSVEGERTITSAFSLGGGIGMLQSWATAELPNPVRRGALYRRLFAPELDLATRQSRWTAVRVFASYRVGSQTTLRVHWQGDRLAPLNDTGGGAVLLTGSRQHSLIELSVLHKPSP